MQNKRGQGLSTNAIILIVLGVVVLVVLVVGFTTGWNVLKDKLVPSTNVKDISQGCQIACSTDSVYDYCNAKRELKEGSETLKDVTCYYLSEKQIKYGIKKCGNICSDVTVIDNCGDNNVGKVMQNFDYDTKTLSHTTCP